MADNATIPSSPELLTLEEVAALLRTTPAHARRRLRMVGAPAALRPFGRPLWRRTEIDAWLDTTAERPTVIAGVARARGPQRRSAA